MAQLKVVKVTYLDFTIIKTRNKISQNLNLGRQDGSTSKGVWWLHLVPKTNVEGQNAESYKVVLTSTSKPQCLSPFVPTPTHNATQNLRWTQWQSITLVPERGKQEEKVQSQPELHSEIFTPNHQLTKQLPTNQTKRQKTVVYSPFHHFI